MKNSYESKALIVSGQMFENCYERAARLIMSTCAPRDPDAARAKAWDIMMGFYGIFEREAAELGLAVLPDTVFLRWEQQKGREKDVKTIRGAIDKIIGYDEMLLAFLKVCEKRGDGLYAAKGDVKLGTLFFRVLDKAGITYRKGSEVAILLESDCADALCELASHASACAVNEKGEVKHDREMVYFSRLVFDETKDWLTDGFDAMMAADGELKALCLELEKRGFYRQVYIDGRRLTMNYLKNYSEKPGELKMSFGEKTRLGIEISLEDIKITPAILSLRIPYYAALMQGADSLTTEAKAFVLSHAKTCDGCRYCVQTDKTGKRPIAAIDMGGEMKCPLYPAFTYTFTELDAALKNELLSFFDGVMDHDAFKAKEPKKA